MPASDRTQPNIIFILVDTLRADRLGVYGNQGGLTPVMDSIADEGVVFERATAPAPWTLPSIASIFTSYYPSVHKAVEYRKIQAMHDKKMPVVSVLQDSFDTLAEALERVGYETAGFVANKFIKKEYGFAQGCEHYDTSFTGDENTLRGEVVNHAAIEWLEQRGKSKRPLFMYLHYMDVHGPYNAAPRFMDPLMARVEAIPPAKRTPIPAQVLRRMNGYLRKPAAGASDPRRFDRLKGYREYWAARYEAGVAEVDFYLGELRKALREQGVWDDSYIIVTADHGEALGEHGVWEHGYTLFQTDLHVPLILRWPGVLPAGKRVDDLVSLLDLMPTLLEQLRVPTADATNFQGRSLLAALSGSADADRSVYAEAIKTWPQTPIRQEALLRGKWKLIRTTDSRSRPVRSGYSLYNLKNDPGEASPVQKDDIARQLAALLDQQSRANSSLKPEMVIQHTGAEDLSDLGYVGDTSEDPGVLPATRPATTQPATQPASADRPGEP